MLEYSDLISKSRIYKNVLSDVLGGALGHCYLVVSTDNVAVTEFFTLLSCSVFCHNCPLTFCRF